MMWTQTLLTGADGARARLRVRHASTGLVQVLQGRLRVDGQDCLLQTNDLMELPDRGYAEIMVFAQGGVIKGNATCMAAGEGVLRLLPSGAVQLTQRRLSFRVRVDHPARIEPLSGYMTPGAPAWVAGRLLDMSLGGGRIACSLQLMPGSTVRLVVPNTPAGDLRLTGHVRAVAATNGPEWTAGLQWVKLPQDEQERLTEAIVATMAGLWGPGARPVRRGQDPLGSRIERSRHLLIELAEVLFRAQQDGRALYEALRITGFTIDELRDLCAVITAELPAPARSTS